MNTLILAVGALLASQSARSAETPERLRQDRLNIKPLRLLGARNLALLAGIVAAAALLSAPWRELAMLFLTLISWVSTSRHIHHANRLAVHPMLEVAAIFVGIFLTMIPALEVLRARGMELGVTVAWEYFCATDLLSSVLDNAPTYLAFLALGQGQHLPAEVVEVPNVILAAISTGACFMGAHDLHWERPQFHGAIDR